MFESPIHWMIVAIVILILFGGRKIPEVMRGLGEGIRNFKEGMAGTPQTPPAQTPPAPPQEKPTEEKKA